MALSDLEKTFAINPFGKQVGIDRKPEAEHNIETVMDEAVENAVKRYGGFNDSVNSGGDYYYEFSKLEINLLTPTQIEIAFLNILKNGRNNSTAKIWGSYPSISEYISKLIQKSYDYGNNNFFLNPEDIQFCIDDFKGTKINPLHITIVGNVYGFGKESKYCTFDIKGDAGDKCGDSAKHCTFNISGNVGDDCGFDSVNCNYNISGNAGVDLGVKSKQCNYIIQGNVDSGVGILSKYCIYNIKGKIKTPIEEGMSTSVFKIVNEKNYDFLVKSLSATNTVQLLDSAGKIIREMKK